MLPTNINTTCCEIILIVSNTNYKMETDRDWMDAPLEQFSSDIFTDNNVSDLQAYYMAQFNLELESGKKKSVNDCVKYDNVTDFEANWFDEANDLTEATDYKITTFTSCSNKDDFDFESLDFESNLKSSTDSEMTYESSFTRHEKADFEQNCTEEGFLDDDEIIMEELCKVDDNVSCRLSPDMFSDEFLSVITKDQTLLPPMETAFSKHYCNYTNRDASIPLHGTDICNNLDIPQSDETSLTINNLDSYSYPNNILNNVSVGNSYILPDTPVSNYEFSYENTTEDGRKISVCESIESDLQRIDYDESSGLCDDIFINYDELAIDFDKDESVKNNSKVTKGRGRSDKIKDKVKYNGEKICLWENCYEKYSNQTTLVDHIERTHVNTYKGEEFRCLWSECARDRRPFNARYKLLIHMRVHSGDKPNRCHHPGCGKAFSRLENLKIHVRSHTGERPYACPAPHCRKAFSNSSDRAKHQRTHFNARPYACGAPGCGKRYTDPSSLRKHVKTHPHSQSIMHVQTHVYAPTRVDKMADKMADRKNNMSANLSPVKLQTIRSIRNKLAPELLNRAKMIC